MATINWENSRRENEASNCQNNNNSIGDKERNDTHNTHGREETYQMTTT